MSTLMAHPYFEEIDWEKLDDSDSTLGKYKELQPYFVLDDQGRYTPRMDSDAWATWNRPMLDLDDLKVSSPIKITITCLHGYITYRLYQEC